MKPTGEDWLELREHVRSTAQTVKETVVPLLKDMKTKVEVHERRFQNMKGALWAMGIVFTGITSLMGLAIAFWRH